MGDLFLAYSTGLAGHALEEADELGSEGQSEAVETQESEDSEGPSGASRQDFENLLVSPVDWTVGTLISLIGNQIDLNPAFQRRAVWSQIAKSRLIESLILSVPVPQILLASMKSDKNKYLVLDGKQRLLAIQEFINGSGGQPGFKLKGLSILSELNGKRWEDFEKDPELKSSLLNESVRTTILRGWSNESALYEIFFRLNSGSVQLSPMELRMALHPGPFLKYIIDYTDKIGPFQISIGQVKPDPRMKDVELLIRFLAMSDGRWQYSGNLKQFLDTACQQFNQEFENEFEKIDSRIKTFEKACSLGAKIFGNDFSKKYSNTGSEEPKYENRFNRVIFEIIVFSLCDLSFAQFASANEQAVKVAFERLSINDPVFVSALSSSTKNVVETHKRYSAWLSACKEISGIEIKLPNIAGY